MPASPMLLSCWHCAQLGEYLKDSKQWQQYVADTLNPRNALENTNAWQCGRPTTHEPGDCAI